MKKKYKILSTIGIIILLMLIYVLYINLIPNQIILDEQPDEMKVGDCWKIKDNRTVCYFGTQEVSHGEVAESDGVVTTNK